MYVSVCAPAYRDTGCEADNLSDFVVSIVTLNLMATLTDEQECGVRTLYPMYRGFATAGAITEEAPVHSVPSSETIVLRHILTLVWS